MIAMIPQYRTWEFVSNPMLDAAVRNVTCRNMTIEQVEEEGAGQLN